MTTAADIEKYLSRMAMGDRAAFTSLYSATSAKLFGVTLRVLNNRAEAEEVLQEVYIKVWHSAARYKVNGLSPMSWLITIARNHSIDRLRTRRANHDGLDQAAEIVDAAPGPEALAIAGSDRARIVRCMAELEADRADAVRRAYVMGETYAELADRYRVPLNTIRTWLRRSLIKLRECLSL